MLEPFFPSFRVRNRWQGGAPKFGNTIHKACRSVNQSTPTAFPTCCSRTLSSRSSSRKHLFSLLLCLPLFYLLTPVVVFLKKYPSLGLQTSLCSRSREPLTSRSLPILPFSSLLPSPCTCTVWPKGPFCHLLPGHQISPNRGVLSPGLLFAEPSRGE